MRKIKTQREVYVLVQLWETPYFCFIPVGVSMQ